MKEYFVWLAKFITTLAILFIGIPLLIGGLVISGMHLGKEEGLKDGKNVVAVIELAGVIESSKAVVDALYKYADDKNVQGIVLRIDSPGGAVAPSQDIFNTVVKLKEKKPIVASMGSLAASGGFYSAMGASKIFAEPGTLAGSIGVIMQIPNFSKVMNVIGVDVLTIKSGSLKDAGNTFRPMTEDERVYLEKTALTVHEQFIRDVAAGRKLPIEKVREFANGRIILGEEAKTLGLVDSMGGIYDAAYSVFELKNKPLLPNERPTLLYDEDRFSEVRKLLTSMARIPRLLSSGIEIRYEMN